MSKKQMTLTNGIDLSSVFGAQERPAFIKKVDGPPHMDWWHIELANSNYGGVHEEHGRALAKDAIRYMRENNNDYVLQFAVAAMMRKSLDFREEAVISGFMKQIGEVLCSVKKVKLYQ